MNVLFHNRHTPHAYMLAQALPEVRFTAPVWNGKFRPQPPNVEVVSFPECLDRAYDAVVEDDPALPCAAVSAPIRIWLQHCEHNGAGYLAQAVAWANRVVVVSEHRRATLRELGFSAKVTVIPPGFDVEAWPQVECRAEAPRVGTTFNGADGNAEVRLFCQAIASRAPFTLIGQENTAVGSGCAFVTPYGLSEYQAALSGLSVWFNCVVGEALGMAPLEAMACGIPVVLGSYPENGSFAFSGWNCLASRRPPADALPWLCEQLRRLQADAGLREEIGRAGRETIRHYFPLSAVREKWLRVLA